MPPKNKARETLRKKLVATRSVGRPLERPRSEKEAIERCRSRAAYASDPMLRRLFKNARGKLPDEMTPGQITSARLVLEVAGVTKGMTLEVSDEWQKFLDEVKA